jgi:lipopolysaccharide/colanic/teichoic acid biosynthesis glycosyltransferase
MILMLPVIALLIKIDSKGPIFYGCDRIGKGGRPFKMYKFRTMFEVSCPVGQSVSPQGDPRITETGRWLRRTKLNEFPQFFNLLRGDMTLLGPRPEAPDLAADYPPEAQEIFFYKPGLIGPNQIRGRNEEEWYPSGVNGREYYLKHILPGKVAIDLEYLKQKTFWGDAKLIWMTVWATIVGAVRRGHLTDNLTQILMIFVDIFCCLASLFLAHILRYGFTFTPVDTDLLRWLLPLSVLARLPVFYYFGFYQTLVRHFSLADVKMVFDGVLAGSAILIVISYLGGLDIRNYGRSICLIDWAVLTFMLIGYRAVAKIYYNHHRGQSIKGSITTRRALIFGANKKGILCYRFLKEHYNPRYEILGFIDPDPKKRNRRIDGLKVLGDQYHLETVAKLYRIQDIFIINGGCQPNLLRRLQKSCERQSVNLKCFLPHSVIDIYDLNKANGANSVA